MAGLYIHIPFCASRCIYCGFYSTTRHSMRRKYIETLCREIAMRHDYLHEPIHTIYIGGGTPSLLDEEQLTLLFTNIDYTAATEITIECNPDDITPQYASMINRLPINRVSMGAQTFNDSRLRFIRRRHSSNDIELAVKLLRDAGTANISIDLMYSFPGETMDEWQNVIDHALALGVEHLSAYSLMFEENTPLHLMLTEGRIKETEEELSAAMYYALIDRLTSAGYEHYEISNFALSGYRSQHNSSYWNATPYMGIGAAAHSFDITSRQWNVPDIDSYMAAVSRGELPMEHEELDMDTRYNDTVMLRLRTCEGINLNALADDFGNKYRNACLNSARRYIDDGMLKHTDDGRLRLTRRGLFVSDMIMSDMMMV